MEAPTSNGSGWAPWTGTCCAALSRLKYPLMQPSRMLLALLFGVSLSLSHGFYLNIWSTLMYFVDRNSISAIPHFVNMVVPCIEVIVEVNDVLGGYDEPVLSPHHHCLMRHLSVLLSMLTNARCHHFHASSLGCPLVIVRTVVWSPLLPPILSRSELVVSNSVSVPTVDESSALVKSSTS